MIEESYIVEIGTKKGKRYARRHALAVPIDAASGRYEQLSNRALKDLVTDLQTEQLRRFTG